MTKNPMKDPEFKRVLGNLLKAPPKHQKDMKVGKKSLTKTRVAKKGDQMARSGRPEKK